jgi:hypothetical protein
MVFAQQTHKEVHMEQYSAPVSPGLIVVLIIVAVVQLVAMWRVFAKAGKPGWAVLIPIYDIIVLFEIVGRPAWWILLMLIPGVNIVIMIMVINDLSKSFGHGVGFTLGLIFLNIIFWWILAFGPSQYLGPGAKQA